MTPGKLSEKIVVERSDWVREMLERIRALPLQSLDAFTADKVTVDAAESCLRRALEALLDLGRHILAKGFGDAPVEYRRVAERLGELAVVAPETSVAASSPMSSTCWGRCTVGSAITPSRSSGHCSSSPGPTPPRPWGSVRAELCSCGPSMWQPPPL